MVVEELARLVVVAHKFLERKRLLLLYRFSGGRLQGLVLNFWGGPRKKLADLLVVLLGLGERSLEPWYLTGCNFSELRHIYHRLKR